MRILGLDLSLNSTGWALSPVRSGVLKPPKGFDRGEARLDWILRQVLDLATEADVAVLEGYSYASANVAHQLGELGGIIRWGLWRRKVPRLDVAPGTLKKFAAGRGNAKKPEMLACAIKRLGYRGHDDNEVDALWLWQAGAIHYGVPGAADLPKAQVEALVKLAWPKIETRAVA